MAERRGEMRILVAIALLTLAYEVFYGVAGDPKKLLGQIEIY